MHCIIWMDNTMKIIGWIEIYRDGDAVAMCSPYYSLAEWIQTNEF